MGADAVDVTVTDGELVATGIEVALSGADEVPVDVEELSYTVSVKDAIQLATATLTFDVDGLENPVVEGVNGWFVLSQKEENGVVTAVLSNTAGVTSTEAVDIAVLKANTTGKTGNVTVELKDAVLSSYVGDSEAFIKTILTNASVTTNVHYSIYDVNQDGKVDQLDITRAQRCYGMNEGDEGWNPLADVNGDHVVDINDLILILNNYTK